MSKIGITTKVFIEPEEGSYKPFNMEPFSEIDEERRNKKVVAEQEFKPDFEGIKEKEFVLGGFEFEYHGGYHRDEVLKKAKDEVDAIINEGKAKVAQIEKEAYDKGYNEGHVKGRSEGFDEVTSLINSLNKTIVEIMSIRQEFYGGAEKEMVDIVALCANEIVRKEISTDKTIIQEVIRDAVKDVYSRQEITIRLNPKDLESARVLALDLSKQVENLKNVKFEQDSTISEGGCLIETNLGRLDATLENRLVSIYKNLKQKVY